MGRLRSWHHERRGQAIGGGVANDCRVLHEAGTEVGGDQRSLPRDFEGQQQSDCMDLVGGDDAKDLNLTVATLTQGTQKQVDIDRILAFLDDPNLDAAYLKEWKKTPRRTRLFNEVA